MAEGRAGLVVVAVPGDKRSRALEEARVSLGLPAFTWLPWSEVLRDPTILARVGRPGDRLRVESPGSDGAIWHALAARGGFNGSVEAGAWRPGRAWATGLSVTLDELAAAGSHLMPTHPDVSVMTDKLACHERLAAAGVPVPETFAAPSELPALREALADRGWSSVFVKARWGSSGAGVMACRVGRHRTEVTTTLSLQEGRLYNDKRLRRYEDPGEVEAVLTPVLADGAIVQRWIPKAACAPGEGHPAGPFDVRVLVVRGRVAQRIARVGRGPITNLHLDAARAPADALLEAVGPGAKEGVYAAAAGAAAVFPRHHTIGVDVGVDARGRPFVMENNAWGDYLPGLSEGGLDPYGVQLSDLFGAAGP